MQSLNPTVFNNMRIFHLDKKFVRGEGQYLYDKEGSQYVDFIAQYGAVPLGYNHQAIWDNIVKFREQDLPSLCQPSIPIVAQELAVKLTSKAPGNLSICTFAQSGAEAVEAAIKLARSTMKKRKILSCHKGFHGKTMAALHATGQSTYQAPFFMDSEDFVKIPFNDLDALTAVLKAQHQEIAAFLVEPVQGEGGVRVPAPNYLLQAAELCRQYGVLLVFDEIQTGLGRMGNWFECTELGITPDILLVSKALGAGLVPISACITSPQVWNESYGLNHSSTFANNNFTCSISLAFLNFLEEHPEIFSQVRENSEYMIKRLLEIQERWPGVIRDVRGKGYLIALEFERIYASDSFEMANLCSQGGLAYLLAGHLLNVHKIRVMPFLNESTSIRIEPPLIINKQDIEYMLNAIDWVCMTLFYKDYYQIYRFTIGDYRKAPKVRDYRSKTRPIITSSTQEQPHNSFAFLCHYPSEHDMMINTPSFEQFSVEETTRIFEWHADYGKPGVVCEMSAFRSKNGNLIKGWLIGIPFGGAQILNRPRADVIQSLKTGIELAQELGATTVGLGAFTSIVSRGGLDLVGMGSQMTTGNTLTVISSVQGLLEGAKQLDRHVRSATAGVVGANGSIGRVCAILLAQDVSRLILVGRNANLEANMKRLRRLANEIYVHALLHHTEERGVRAVLRGLLTAAEHQNLSPKCLEAKQRLTELFAAGYTGEGEPQIIDQIETLCASLGIKVPIDCKLDIEAVLPEMDLVLTATSNLNNLLPSHLLKRGAVVCDVSRPANVGLSVRRERQDVLVIEGGLIRYQDPVSFGQNFGYKPGVNLACLSETMLLTLEGDTKSYGIGGRITMEEVYYVQSLAKKHGFELASLHSHEKELMPEDIAQIRANAGIQSITDFDKLLL